MSITNNELTPFLPVAKNMLAEFRGVGRTFDEWERIWLIIHKDIIPSKQDAWMEALDRIRQLNWRHPGNEVIDTLELLDIRTAITTFIENSENAEITDTGFGCGGFDIGFILNGVQYYMGVGPRTEEID